MAERIDKLLAHEGYGSRKDIKKLLRSATVLLNGKQIYDSSIQINPAVDEVSVDGEPVDFHQNIFIMMNKIMHTVSSTKDGEHQTVFDLLDDKLRTPYLLEKLHLVGRLDMDTEGLLLFTTDGDFTHRVTSPKTHVDKTYFVILEHAESEDSKAEIEDLFARGIEVGPEDNEAGFKCQPAKIKWCSQEEFDLYTSNSSYLEALARTQTVVQNCNLQAALLTITEGKYHQVKRMFKAVNNSVAYLKRISMGKITLDFNLKCGGYKILPEIEE